MMGLPFAPVPARVHLVGVGGVGMAGLARILHQSGCQVSGSDLVSNRLTDALEEEGVLILKGHRRSHLPAKVDWAVRTPAVAEMNPEVTGLRERGVPVYSRGQVLAALCNPRNTFAIAGAHGKTTTSAMLAWIFHHAEMESGYVIGGETALPGCVADLGGEGPFVVEADESDGTLVAYHPQTAILTHVEWDHPERFPTEESLWRCYRTFIGQSDSIWIRGDDDRALALTDQHAGVKKVGLGSDCELQLLEQRDHPDGQEFRFCYLGEEATGGIALPGLHNTWNAVMALGAACEAGVDLRVAVQALSHFPSVARRFQLRTERGVCVIQDYAHHPTEIRAALVSVAARNAKRVRVVFQPHRYSRTLRLLDAFADAFTGLDTLDLLPVYAASEAPSLGVNSDVLAQSCRARGLETTLWDHTCDLIQDLTAWAEEGDMIALLGAGDIGALYDQVIPETD